MPCLQKNNNINSPNLVMRSTLSQALTCLAKLPYQSTMLLQRLKAYMKILAMKKPRRKLVEVQQHNWKVHLGRPSHLMKWKASNKGWKVKVHPEHQPFTFVN